MRDDFDWSEFRGDEVVRSQRAIVVYLNPDEDVVIRQEEGPGSDGDDWIVIPKRDVFQLIQKLKKLTEAN